MSDDVEQRAERLGAALMVCGLVREPATAAIEALGEVPLLTADEVDAWRALDDDDIALAHACLTAQFEVRAREFAALEALGEAWAMGTGDTPEERVASMPAEAARVVLLAMLALGWDYLPPDDDPET